MRRLTLRRPWPGGRHPLARLRDERGAVAVMFALLAPILFGAAALAIDTAGVWSARQQVENGADAAVIAVLTNCADGSCGSTDDIKQQAQDAFFANDKAGKVSDLGAGVATITVTSNRGYAGSVTVVQTTPWQINHFFAAALGYPSGELTVQSSGAWAPIARATTKVPLAVSWCTFSNARSLSATTLSLTSSLSGSCSTPSGGSVVTGTAATVADSGSACATTSVWKGTVRNRVSGLPSGCSAAYLSGLVGQDLLLPVFDSTAGSGGSQTFTVYGYAAFHVTSASATSLGGSFTSLVRQVDDTTPPATTAPDLGARAIFLTSST